MFSICNFTTLSILKMSQNTILKKIFSYKTFFINITDGISIQYYYDGWLHIE